MSNTIELIGHYGGDITHSLSAWTSTVRELNEDKIQRIPKLLEMLASNEHGTPFEKSLIHFLVDSDIASHIHMLKHRIGVSINGESARYKELKEDKVYIPTDWNAKWKSKLVLYNQEGNKLYHECLEELTPILGRKRAKESARYFKTYSSQIMVDISFNWRSFAHFYYLRASEHSQKEIAEIAEKMLQLIKEIPGNPFENTIKAFEL